MKTFNSMGLINKLNCLFQDDPYVIGEWALHFHETGHYEEYTEHEYGFNNIWKEKFIDGAIFYIEVVIEITIYEPKNTEQNDNEEYKTDWDVSIIDEFLPKYLDIEKMLDYVLDVIDDKLDDIVPK